MVGGLASRRSLAAVAGRLEGDGVAFVRVPPWRRRPPGRLLARLRLRAGEALTPVPFGVPRALLAAGGSRRTVLAALPLSRSWRAVLPFVPPTGALVQREDARPAWEWLLAAGLERPLAISGGWHDPDDGLVLVGAGTVTKTSRGGARRDPLREAELLRRLGPSARAAGAAVPEVRYAGELRARRVLVEELLPGVPAAQLLQQRPRLLPGLLDDVAGWLGRWHVETRAVRALGEDDVERLLLAPAGELGLDADRLARLAAPLLGADVPFAAAHNDLTMWNVLSGAGGLGVVDWEAAAVEALPLVDLDYLVVDAVSWARRAPRQEAYARCADGGADAGLARTVRARVLELTGVAPEVADLARRACWLGHARNEPAAGRGGARPFLAIARAAVEA